ncbi:hypothetical protein ACF3NG_02125 [Aerococcaceae bacterium WGS1372]
MPVEKSDKECVMHGSLQIDGKHILFLDKLSNEAKALDASIAMMSSDAEHLQSCYQKLEP